MLHQAVWFDGLAKLKEALHASKAVACRQLPITARPAAFMLSMHYQPNLAWLHYDRLCMPPLCSHPYLAVIDLGNCWEPLG